jgi:hypothetical protein
MRQISWMSVLLSMPLTLEMTLYLFVPLAVTGGRRGVMVASELAADRSGLLTELGGVVLSADAVSRVFVDLLACRESIELFELCSELDLEL